MSEPCDAFESEADRIADAVVGRGGGPARSFSISRVAVSRLQRDEDTKPKTEEQKGKEAATKAGEAFMETDLGKKIKEKLLDDSLVKAGEDFISTLPGKVITGTVAVGAISALAVTHKELPVPIPEIPLDRWAPGLKVRLTYEGPVDHPSKAMIAFIYSEGSGAKGKTATTETERMRNETARIAAEQARFRAGLRYSPGSRAEAQQKAEEEAFRHAIESRIGRLPGEGWPKGIPNVPAPPPSLELIAPRLGFKPKPIHLLDEELELKPSTGVVSDEKAKKKEGDEEGTRLMRKEASQHAANNVPPIVDEVLASPGRRLDPATRTFMEARFGCDFGRVRIHSDARAVESARAVDALAYTVGPDVVIGSQLPSSTPEVRRLLAHELTHVVQQGTDQRVAQPTLQRKGGTFGGFFSNIGRAIASIFVDEPGFSDATLQRYLAVIDAGGIEDDFDSDDKARIVVRRWMAGAPGFSLSKERKALLIQEMVSGFTGDADEEAILNLLAGSPDPELTYIFGVVSPATLRGEIHGAERAQFERIVAGWTDRTGPTPSKDVMAGTHAVTRTEHAFVESTLTPGSTLAPAAPGPVGAPPPPPVVVPPPAMTGLPPGIGVAGAFETAIVAKMKSYVAPRGGAFRARKAAGPPAFPTAKANAIALTAQQQSESYFARYIRVASRAPADPYHPGSYDLTTTLGDQSTVPITDAGVAAAPGVTPHPGRIGWMGYWMEQDSSGGKAIMNTFHCVPSARAIDRTEFNRVRNKLATDPVNRTDIDDTIHGWPAEATGGVNIQPYQAQTRSNRWDLFTTLIHEMMHVLQHPNYERTWKLIGGDAQEILKEGMADVMRHDLWDGPGLLATRLATPAYAPVRRQIEGKDLPYDAAAVSYHSDYLDKYPKAKKIVDGGGGYPGVGIENARAAFFLGHTELLGLGAGTATEGGVSLAGVASWKPSESDEADIILTGPGDTETTVRTRTGAPAGGVLTAAGAAAAGAAFAAGTKLRIPGVRHVYALQEDTLGSLATQNGVTVAALTTANRLPPGTPPSHKFPAGMRILIPRRIA